ncbi:ATP-binding protein [Pseudophaeobacter arcticus]|uniref:ATP-binding protein n=1 Tax=Pseudophaeobacter arcticus TaxID=385492 RepID=UPI000410C9D5|nr:ATP-binding protein [Pseudophaeobacter arcticus]
MNDKSSQPEYLPWDEESDFVAQQYAVTMGRRFRTVSVTCNLVVVLGLLWIVLGVFINAPSMVIISAIAIVGSIAASLLLKTEYTLLARLLWYFTGWAAVMGSVFTMPPESYIELFFVVLLGGPFMTFSMRREKAMIVTLLGIVFGSWLMFRFLGSDYFGPPLVEVAIPTSYLTGGVLVTVFAVLVVEMMAFGELAESYSDDLLRAHQKESQANHAKSEFLAAMSHEIRTPMNGVLGMVEVLERTELTPEQRRILHTIQDSSTSLLWIIDDILDVSRIEAGKMELFEAPMRLLPLIEGATATLRPYASQMDVDLSLAVQSDLPDTLKGDAGRVRQILLNLIGNAIKFSEPLPDETAGRVRLRVEICEPGWIDFVVEDNGIGIEPEVQEAIFAPFERSAVVAKRMIKGNGLGLTIVQQLVSKMGGTVSVDSTLGEGSTFTVRLPVLEPSGPIKGPRLAGTKVVAMLPEQGRDCNWPTYVLAADCDLKWVASREEFLALARLAGRESIFVLPEETADDHLSSWCRTRIEKELPDLKVLEFKSCADMQKFSSNNRWAVVQSGPVLPSELWEALESLVGYSNKEPKEPKARPGTKGRSAALNKTGGRILVAEDNEINRAVIESQLALLGCTVTMTRDGAECLSAWQNGQFDMVLADCQMPVMDGFELTRAIRQIETERGLRHTPIVAVTANALEGEIGKCLAEGMDAFVSKPVTIAGLEAVIRQQLPASVVSAETRRWAAAQRS